VRIKFHEEQLHFESPDVPVMLQVSREARTEGLRRYHTNLNAIFESSPILYFDPELDTAAFDWLTPKPRPNWSEKPPRSQTPRMPLQPQQHHRLSDPDRLRNAAAGARFRKSRKIHSSASGAYSLIKSIVVDASRFNRERQAMFRGT
jgi:hypothetical protein